MADNISNIITGNTKKATGESPLAYNSLPYETWWYDMYSYGGLTNYGDGSRATLTVELDFNPILVITHSEKDFIRYITIAYSNLCCCMISYRYANSNYSIGGSGLIKQTYNSTRSKSFTQLFDNGFTVPINGLNNEISSWEAYGSI